MADNTQQFVIQEHTTAEGVHWDLMLQMQDVLWTWRIHEHPAQIGNESIRAERIFDHDLRFLTYEGPVQNNTGQVRMADKGIYQINHQTDTSIDIQLEGNILSGTIRLSCIEGAAWQLKKSS